MATEPTPDPLPLRQGRRARLFAAMEAHDLDVLVLGRVANIRYASGVPILWNAGTRPFGPGCVVVRRSEEIYLLSTWDEGVPDEIPHDHLFGITWNPMNFVALLQGIAADAGPRRVGTDAMSPLFAQLLPMAFGDAEIVDAGAALRSARRTKTADEIEAIRHAIGVAEESLAVAVAELRPGVGERELTGVFMDAMASTRHHHAGDAGRRPHHVRGRHSRLPPATAWCRPVTSSRSMPASWPTATPARWVAPGPSRLNGNAAAIERLYRRSDDAAGPTARRLPARASGTGLLDAYRGSR